jgi:hypothetical protein
VPQALSFRPLKPADATLSGTRRYRLRVVALVKLHHRKRESSFREGQASAARLQKKRDKLVAQIDAVDAEMAKIGVSASNAPRPTPSKGKGRSAAPSKRPKNELTLADALTACADVGAVVSPQEAADLVKKNGYKSKSATFGGQVANALAKHPKFKKQGRAQYKRMK